MARPSNAEKAAKEAAKVVEQVEETSVEQIQELVKDVEVDLNKVLLVRMVLHPDIQGKARTADVHPFEVDNYADCGWMIED